ncbi:methylated-DNA--[protein]-cysteine S-methyltransferase [Brevibacillus fluminis]|uniref:methylated-DNA--[protein]-cysteine S-methyltransferase n=1 Tax=Brevibacillus fluminis TaxID=511487 RepID=UPI003F8B5D17
MAGTVGYTAMETPIGSLLVASTEKGLCYIHFSADEDAVRSLAVWCQKHGLQLPVPDDERNGQAVAELEQYFAGIRRDFTVALDLYGTPFQQTVWTALTHIPYGETRSYKDIAEFIGSSKAVRAVGGANNKNPIPLIIPCHRVIGAGGSMVGYGGGLSIKEHLLRLEGVLPPATEQISLFAAE